MQKKLWIFSGIFVLIDQIIKILVSNYITYNTDIEIISNFFYLTNVHNDGAAFSAFAGNLIFLIIMTIISLCIVYYFFVRDKELKGLNLFIVSMLIGGIIGNFIDRIIHGYVIDYLRFIIFKYQYPIFNFADTCIVISVMLLLIISFKEDLWKNTKSRKKVEE